jgi:hypothetical protein
MAEGEIRSMIPESESELWVADKEGVLTAARQHLCKCDVTWTVDRGESGGIRSPSLSVIALLLTPNARNPP